MISNKRFTVSAIYLSAFAGMFFITSRSVILPTVLRELQAEKYYNAAVLIMSLFMCIVLPVAGKLSDRYGRKRICLIGGAGFIFSTVLCMVSVSIGMYLAGLALSGIFFGLINAVQLAFLHDLFEASELTGKVSNLTIANSSACLAGPLFAGVFTDYVSWRAVYLLLIPMLIYMVAALAFYKEEKERAEVKKENAVQNNKKEGNGAAERLNGQRKEKAEPSAIGRFDWKGVLFFIVIIFPAMLLLSGKKINLYSNQAVMLLLILCMIIGIAGFIRTEKQAENAFIPFSLFSNKAYTGYLLVYLAVSVGYAAINFLPAYYQQVRGVTVLMSSLLILPRQFAQIGTGFLLKKADSRLRNRRLAVCLGLLCLTGSLLFMTGFGTHTSLVRICVVEALFGFSNSFLTILCQSDSQKALPESFVGSGTALVSFTGAFGNTLGAGILGFFLCF